MEKTPEQIRNRATLGLVFLMVGAYPDPYLDILRNELERLALPGVHLVDQVTDSYSYYRLADIFVCSSFEEAFPRVVMEAAAFGLPIVSLCDTPGFMVGPEAEKSSLVPSCRQSYAFA